MHGLCDNKVNLRGQMDVREALTDSAMIRRRKALIIWG